MVIKLLNKIITKLKGSNYSLDTNISSGYLFGLLFNRVLMLIRGKLSFINNNGILFIGKNVTLKAKSRMSFGRGVTIDSGCYLNALSYNGITFGDNVSIGKHVVIECSGSLKFLGKGLKVGNNVGLGADCFYGCAGGIEIGDDTIIGNFVSFHSENHNSDDLSIPIRLQGVNHKGIMIGRNCWLGAKVTVLDGAILEDGCIIAAGAVITPGIYPGNQIYGGVPAKFLKSR